MTNWATRGLGRGGLLAVIAGIALVGCGGKEQAAGNAGFLPVSRAQPTEGGAWVVDPGDPLTLYALGRRSMRSRDGGHTWAELAWPADARSLLIARVPTHALYLDVGDQDVEQRFKSLDEGDTWTKLRAGSGGGLAMVDGSSGPVLLNVTDQRISRSADDGSTWVDSVLPPIDDTFPLTLARTFVSTGASPIVYVEAWGFNSAISNFQSLVLVSNDAGATFLAKSVPVGPGVTPSAPPRLSLDCRGRLYVLVGTSVDRSDDAGATWQNVATLDAGVEDFQAGQGVAGACSESVYAFGEILQQFTLWQLGADGTVHAQALPDVGPVADLGADRLLLLSTLGSIRQRSDDGGRSWWTAGVNLEDGNLAVSPVREGLLFVTTSRTVLRSENAGQTWQALANTGRNFVRDPYPDPGNANVLYVRSISGEDTPWSFISTDGGASVQNWPVPTQDNPEIPQAISSSSAGRITVVTQQGVYATEDAGHQFTPLMTLPAQQQVLWAAIGASEPPAIYASVSSDSSSKILASVDGGATWSSADSSTYVAGLVAHPTDPKIAFTIPGGSGANDGPLRTLDGGKTWSQLAPPGGDTIAWLRVAASPPYDLYALGQHLYRSHDNGDSWQLLSDAPPDSFDFQIDPHPGSTRYILGQGGLLYKMTE